MKKTIILLLLSCLCIHVMAQTKPTEAEKRTKELTQIGKVWGFLKYFHPRVAGGEVDWDGTLVQTLSKTYKGAPDSQLTVALLGLIDAAGGIQGSVDIPLAKLDSGADWINDTYTLSGTVAGKLRWLYVNHKPSATNAYVHACRQCVLYQSEDYYKQDPFPSTEYRLLALFRYWNVINYFYPYPKVPGHHWEEVLSDFIPKILLVKDEREYDYVLRELSARLQDTHAWIFRYKAKKAWYPPFDISFIDGKPVISQVYHQDSSKESLRKGDVILMVNYIPVRKLQDSLRRFVGGSNKAIADYNLNYRLINNPDDSSAVIDVMRGRKYLRLAVKYEDVPNSGISGEADADNPTVKDFPGNIGYINLTRTYSIDPDTFILNMRNKKAIIIDLRGYVSPKIRWDELICHIPHKRTVYARFIKPSFEHPGTFTYTNIKTARYKRRKSYKGPIYVLVNEKTRWLGERTCLALQTAYHVTLIGSQTGGSPGNYEELPLPGGISAFFTGPGIDYPGADTRIRSSISPIPANTIRPTIQGLYDGKDEVLEEALRRAGK